jgi:hypothetical protein
MRYIMLIYSKEPPATADGSPPERNFDSHRALILEATRQGVFIAAEPLAPASGATTVRIENGKPLVTDGPFAETKEQLAGYYVLECESLAQAVEWAAKLPGACRAGETSVEIRAMPGIPAASR